MFYIVTIDTVDKILYAIIEEILLNKQKMNHEKAVEALVKHYLDNDTYYEVTEYKWPGGWLRRYPKHIKVYIKHHTHRFKGIFELCYLEK